MRELAKVQICQLLERNLLEIEVETDSREFFGINVQLVLSPLSP